MQSVCACEQKPWDGDDKPTFSSRSPTGPSLYESYLILALHCHWRTESAECSCSIQGQHIYRWLHEETLYLHDRCIKFFMTNKKEKNVRWMKNWQIKLILLHCQVTACMNHTLWPGSWMAELYLPLLKMCHLSAWPVILPLKRKSCISNIMSLSVISKVTERNRFVSFAKTQQTSQHVGC